MLTCPRQVLSKAASGYGDKGALVWKGEYSRAAPIARMAAEGRGYTKESAWVATQIEARRSLGCSGTAGGVWTEGGLSGVW